MRSLARLHGGPKSEAITFEGSHLLRIATIGYYDVSDVITSMHHIC